MSFVYKKTEWRDAPVDEARCRAQVSVFSGWRFCQCQRKAVEQVGEYRYCKQHAKLALQYHGSVE